jgi:hypothetical protein
MTRYNLLAPEAGSYAEIYLPKKAKYEGELYDALTDGFDCGEVIKYLKDHRNIIREFMGPAKEFYDASIIDDPPTYFPDLYAGYSMYEVDGVFKPKKVGGPVIEERTQVIRIMFKLDLGLILGQALAQEITTRNKFADAEVVARAYLRSHHWDKSNFLRDYMSLGRKDHTDLNENELLDVLRNAEIWARSAGLFLFGYIVHRITEIANEEEIWVTFFWNLIITRTVPQKSL